MVLNISSAFKGGPWAWIGVNLPILAKMIFCHNLLINIFLKQIFSSEFLV